MAINWIHNFPFFSIFLTMLGGIVTALIRDPKKALRLHQMIAIVVAILSLFLLISVTQNQESFTFMMGHFPAPWGNELRAGPLEALMAFFFSIIMFLTVTGGQTEIFRDIVTEKIKYFFVMMNLIFGSILALIYTNDVFTAYVFIEINTIASCAVIMAKGHGRSMIASIHYLIMSSLGSGLFLIGLCILYALTGHLLMPNIQQSLIVIAQSGEYHYTLLVVTGLIFIGLSVKSALFPFHTMLPNAYDHSVSAGAGILSGLVLKSYIILILKMIFNVFSFEVIQMLRIQHVLFVFGILGMIMGSIYAFKEVRIKKMLAFSSVAQVGYIFMGFGIGNMAGFVAACFHILAHAATKTLLFVSVGSLIDTNGGKKGIRDLQGTGRKNPFAGVAYTVGALSMVGVPLFAGFASKYFFAVATTGNQLVMTIVLAALAVSMILNAIYFIPTVISIWSEPTREFPKTPQPTLTFKVVCVAFIAINFILGMYFKPIIEVINLGLQLLG
ncbi:MAG: proton-conducting transporter membrane subunit [Erysipelotrichaceae bacterium]|nr:proton-conducting transporter membrane subunit [Erysipelotrichaceae bacterium]